MRRAWQQLSMAPPQTAPGDGADFRSRVGQGWTRLEGRAVELDKLCAMRPDTARRIRLRTAISETASKLKMIDLQVAV